MRVILISILGVIVLTGSAISQTLQDGDLVVAWDDRTSRSAVLVYHVAAGSWSTIHAHATPSPTSRIYSVRMARNNASLVVGAYLASPGKFFTSMLHLDPTSGKSTTLAVVAGGRAYGMSLDPDGWIAGGISIPFKFSHVWRIDDTSATTAVVTTLASFPPGGIHSVTDVAIDRRFAPKMPYVLTLHDGTTQKMVPRLLRADRTGAISTVVATNEPSHSTAMCSITEVEFDPRVDAYVVANAWGHISSIHRSGRSLTTLVQLPNSVAVTGARFTSRGTLWTAVSGSSPYLAELDMSGNNVGKVIRTVKVPTAAATSVGLNHVEIYGSRMLQCQGTGRPGTAVQVRLSSRRPGDATKRYALACSTRRRPRGSVPCLQFNGAYLFLDHGDLFAWISTQNLWPSIFDNFRGVIDANGNATAAVNIPGDFPSNTGLTLFVAGVIFDKTGVLSVTNTHWFVLN